MNKYKEENKKMLKIGITEKVYCSKYGFKNGLERMKKHGYDALDYLEFANTETPLFEKNSSEFEAYLKEQKKIAENCGIEIFQTHGPWRWPLQDFTKEDREERFEKMSRSIVGTTILGCRNFVIHPIMPFTTHDEEHKRETYEMNVEFMERLKNVGRENDVVICLENMPMPRFSLGSVPAILEFVKVMNSEYFKVCFDTGHATFFELSVGDAVRLLGKEYLYTLHIHDNDGNGDKHWEPFRGLIDWEDFGHALHEIQYDGVVSLEANLPKLPDELCEMEEIALCRKAQYIAALAAGRGRRNDE